jgi:hypothetical protein
LLPLTSSLLQKARVPVSVGVCRYCFYNKIFCLCKKQGIFNVKRRFAPPPPLSVIHRPTFLSYPAPQCWGRKRRAIIFEYKNSVTPFAVSPTPALLWIGSPANNKGRWCPPSPSRRLAGGVKRDGGTRKGDRQTSLVVTQRCRDVIPPRFREALKSAWHTNSIGASREGHSFKLRQYSVPKCFDDFLYLFGTHSKIV